MKYSIGYQLPEGDEQPIREIVKDYAEVEEVYFPWLDVPSGRSPLASREGFTDWQAQQRLEADLLAFKGMGIKLNLLLNASCYGGQSFSRALWNGVLSIVSHLQDLVGLDAVTTMSPLIAATIKREFPSLEVRASVNMRLGTVKALQYASHLFDSYHVQREYNRDLERVAELKEWCDANGKGLYMLANSGCLCYCAVQTYHDNLVAHEGEVAEMISVPGQNPALCWEFYQDAAHWVTLLQNSWVRPEDIDNYAPYFSVLKLATRMHSNPRAVVRAYCERRYAGNLLDLFEPGHAPLLAPHIIDNSRFPADWCQNVTQCSKECHRCDYCASVLRQVLVDPTQE